MSLTHAFARLFARSDPSEASIACRQRRRLALETLEERAAPAINIWVGPQNGLWSNSANWSLRHAPIASDSLYFYGPGTGTGTGGRNTNSINDVRSVQVTEIRGFGDFTATITIGANTNVSTLASSIFTGQLALGVNSSLTTTGVCQVNGSLTASGPATVTTTAGLNLAGNAVVMGGGGVTPGLRVNGVLNAVGSLTVGLNSALSVSGECNLNGTTTISQNGQVVATGTAPVIITGQTTMLGATIKAGLVKTVGLGTIVTTSGVDTIVGSFANSGNIRFAGPTAHNFTVTKSYNQLLGKLTMRVGASASDRLVVQGAADLANGSLIVSAPFASQPFPGFSTTLVGATGGVRGQFGSVSLPTPMFGMVWVYQSRPFDFFIALRTNGPPRP